MAVIRRAAAPVAVRPKVAVAKPAGSFSPGKRTGGSITAPVEGRTLSTVLSEPVKRLEEVNWVLYGDAGIGKTSLAAMFPSAYFLFFEPGGKGLRLNKSECYLWTEFRADVSLLCGREGRPFQTVVFDIVDTAYDRCFEYVCKRDGMQHPNDKGWGEGWKAIRKEFESQILRLSAAGKSLVFLSHADDKRFQTRSGREYQKIVPSMGGQAWDFIGGFCDVIGFYGYYGDERFLTIRGSDEVDAKCRLKYQFRTRDGKRPVHSIPMSDSRQPDFSEEQAFANLRAAFENRQAAAGEPEETVTLANIAAKPKPRAGRV
jgi:hypothetical protein